MFSDHFSGAFDSGDWHCRHCNGLRGAETETHCSGQPAGASPLGWRHHRAADECSTYSSHHHVPVTQTWLRVASGGGQWFCCFQSSQYIKWESQKKIKCAFILWGIKRASQRSFADICAFVFHLAKWFQHSLERQNMFWNTGFNNTVNEFNDFLDLSWNTSMIYLVEACIWIWIMYKVTAQLIHVIIIMSALAIYYEYAVSSLSHCLMSCFIELWCNYHRCWGNFGYTPTCFIDMVVHLGISVGIVHRMIVDGKFNLVY